MTEAEKAKWVWGPFQKVRGSQVIPESGVSYGLTGQTLEKHW